MKIAVPAEADKAETRVAATPETVKKFIALGAEVSVQAGGRRGRAHHRPGFRGGRRDGRQDRGGGAEGRRRRIEGAPSRGDGTQVVQAGRDRRGDHGPLRQRRGAQGARGCRPRRLRHGADAAHHAGAVDGRALQPGEPCRLPGGDRGGLVLWPGAANDDDGGGHRAGGARLRHGRRRRGPAGDRDRRRLGAVVTATDVRPAAKEQVESLGAKFVAVEDDEFKQAETAAGYAKPMSAEYQAKQAALVAEHIKKQDIVITTALIPGRPAPRLVSSAMVASMRPGSVLVDLAVERGGNVEGVKPGEVAEVGDVTIVGHLNVAGEIAASASCALFAQPLQFRRDADRTRPTRRWPSTGTTNWSRRSC